MGHRQIEPRDPETPRLSQRGLSRRGAKAYQVVLEAVLCVPAGALLGWGIDQLAGTEPWGVLGGVTFGFVAFVMNAIRLPKRLAVIQEDGAADEFSAVTNADGTNEDPKP